MPDIEQRASTPEAQRRIKDAARFQREQLLRKLERAGAAGLTAREVAAQLLWPLDSAFHWITESIRLGEIGITGGDFTADTEAHYVLVEHCSASSAEEAL